MLWNIEMTNEYSRLFAHFGAQRDYTSELTVNYRVVYCIPSSANILAEGKKKHNIQRQISTRQILIGIKNQDMRP